jgi:hypothetical protein
VPIAHIELNENMELAYTASISPSGAQHVSRVGRRGIHGFSNLELHSSWRTSRFGIGRDHLNSQTGWLSVDLAATAAA